jgi:NAD(P)-dependent dehydrogenase (short-subunit alcohol dehydrogenase family)
MTSINKKKPLAGRITLVTGASRGIGYASAVALARAGSHIIATARTQGGLEDLDDEIRSFGGETTLVPLDLKQADGIDQLGKIIHDRWGRLDGLLSNAGILGELAPVPHISVKSFEETIVVNLLANFRIIRSMDPLLRASPAGRALFVSSRGAQSRSAFWGLYAASKSGLDAMVQSYAKETEKTDLRVNLLYPGPVRTQMRAKAMPGEDPETLRTPAEIAELLVPYLSPEIDIHGEIIDLRNS